MIERVATCNAEQFTRLYLEPRRPIVLTGLADRWPALAGWTPAAFGSRFGERKIQVRRNGTTYRTTLAYYVDYLKKQTQSSRRPNSTYQGAGDVLYLHALVLADALPELLGDFNVPDLFSPNWLEDVALAPCLPIGVRQSFVLFMGPEGASSKTHRDRYHTHAWFTQLYGEKNFQMLAPDLLSVSYQDSQDKDRACIGDLAKFDAHQYPELDPKHIEDVWLGPGDTLFIPAGWWHSARCLTTSVSLSENFVNASNFKEFSRDIQLPAQVLAAVANSRKAMHGKPQDANQGDEL